MAFNPFKNFQKHRKYWMASVLLMCMMTFVVCTGVGGDLSERILSWFNFRKKGEEVMKINGRPVYQQDLEDLKTRRNIAQDFMTKLTDFGIHRIKDAIDEHQKAVDESKVPLDKADDDMKLRRARLEILTPLHLDLIDRRSRTRYFGSGTTLDDLANFMFWLEVADKKDIRPSLKNVQDMISNAVHGRVFGFDDKTAAQLQTDVKYQYNTTNDTIIRALTDEFRVRIAKLASLEARSRLWISGGLDADRTNMPRFSFDNAMFPTQVRLPVSPEQLFAYYTKHVTPTDMVVLPVTAAEFAPKVPAPTEEDLKKFFEEHKDKPFNPNSEQPGFTFPKKSQIAYIMADPDAEAYRRASQAVTALIAAPVPGAVVPIAGQPLPVAIAGLCRPAAFEASLQRDLEFLSAPGRKNWDKYYFPGWPAPYASMAHFLTERDPKEPKYKPDAATAASLVAAFGGGTTAGPLVTPNLARLDLLDNLVRTKEKKWAAITAEDSRERALLSARLMGLLAPGGFGPTPWAGMIDPKSTPVYHLLGGEVTGNPKEAAFGKLTNIEFLRRVPLTSFVRDEIRHERVEKQLAHRWANEIMLTVERELDKAKSNPTLFDLEVRRDLLKKYRGFLKYQESAPYHQYNIHTAPELRDLYDEFERRDESGVAKYIFAINAAEGRSGTPRQLKEDDFNKLFFEGESFSVGNTATFIPKPWPPRLVKKRNPYDPGRPGEREPVIDYFKTAERPILFWRIADDPAGTPKTMDAVRHEVERSWKTYKAAQDLKGQVKEVTDALTKSEKEGKSFDATLAEQAKAVGRATVPLRVSQLVASEFRGPFNAITYQPYELPRTHLEFPRNDTLANLLALSDLKEPISTFKNKDKFKDAVIPWLDDLNKQLFDSSRESKTGYVIQVLTNKPQTAFYVVATRERGEQIRFTEAFYQYAGFVGPGRGIALTPQGRVADTFIDFCQTEMGKEFIPLFLEKITAEGAPYERIITNDSVRKHFDTEGQSK